MSRQSRFYFSRFLESKDAYSSHILMAKSLYYAVQRSMIFAMRHPRLSWISPNGTSAIQLVTRHVSRKNTSYAFTHEVVKYPLVLTLVWFWSISALGLHWFRGLVQRLFGVHAWDFHLLIPICITKFA